MSASNSPRRGWLHSASGVGGTACCGAPSMIFMHNQQAMLHDLARFLLRCPLHARAYVRVASFLNLVGRLQHSSCYRDRIVRTTEKRRGGLGRYNGKKGGAAWAATTSDPRRKKGGRRKRQAFSIPRQIQQLGHAIVTTIYTANCTTRMHTPLWGSRRIHSPAPQHTLRCGSLHHAALRPPLELRPARQKAAHKDVAVQASAHQRALVHSQRPDALCVSRKHQQRRQPAVTAASASARLAAPQVPHAHVAVGAAHRQSCLVHLRQQTHAGSCEVEAGQLRGGLCLAGTGGWHAMLPRQLAPMTQQQVPAGRPATRWHTWRQ